MKVELIDYMGNDLSVIRAATASFAKDPVEWDETKHPRLLNYLARGMTQADYTALVNDIAGGGYRYFTSDDGCDGDDGDRIIKSLLEQYRHTPLHFSPFTHTAITLRLKAPIAIHAQMMKHTVGFAHNTVSRRYVSETPEIFVPEFREAPEGNVKQGSGEVIPSDINWDKPDQAFWQEYYRVNVQACIDAYDYMIRQGISPEQARFVLPQGVMTEWVSTGSLYAWARFYNQRTDQHAQKEIQDLAKMVGEIIEPLYPASWRALIRQ